MTTSVYHDGERAVQYSAGEVAIADRNGAPWATILFGQPGFAHAEQAAVVSVDLPAAQRDPHEPFWRNVAANPTIGSLFIELASRRRYRINGSLQRLDQRGFALAVREAYPNCPRYIQRRQLRRIDDAAAPGLPEQGGALGPAARAIVRGADTIFVASNHHERGADASHPAAPGASGKSRWKAGCCATRRSASNGNTWMPRRTIRRWRPDPCPAL